MVDRLTPRMRDERGWDGWRVVLGANFCRSRLICSATDVMHTEARPFVNAYTSHAKILLASHAGVTHLDKRRSPTVSNSVLGWTAFLRDALTSAHQGRAPAFSDDDLFLLTKEGKNVPIPLRVLLEHQEPSLEGELDVGSSFWTLFKSIMHQIASLARQVSRHLTGARARKAEWIHEEFANFFLTEATYVFEALPELRRREALVRVIEPELYLTAGIPTLVRTLSFSTCTLSWLINRIVGQRLAGRHPDTTKSLADRGSNGGALTNSRGQTMMPWPAMPGPSNDEAYWQRLFVLRRKVYAQAFRASRQVASIIGETIEQGYSLSSAWLDPRFVQVLFTRLPFWVSSIVNMPTAEQGGPHPNFSFSDKLYDLEAIKKGCFSVGWMDFGMGNSADWIKAEIAKTEAARADYWDARAASPVIEVEAPSPRPAFAEIQLSMSSVALEQLAQAGILPQQAQQGPSPGLGLAADSHLPPGFIASWPPSGTSTSSAGTTHPTSPPSAQERSPSSSLRASPPSSGLQGFDLSAHGQPLSSAAEMHALWGQYSVPPPPVPAATLLLSLCAQAQAPAQAQVQAQAQAPLSQFGLPAGSPAPTADMWQAFAHEAHGSAAPDGAGGVRGQWHGHGDGLGHGHGQAFGQAPLPKALLQGNPLGVVDWDAFLGMGING